MIPEVAGSSPVSHPFNIAQEHLVGCLAWAFAVNSAQTAPATVPLWQVVIGKYPPTFIGEYQKSITWSENMVRVWLADRMFTAMLH